MKVLDATYLIDYLDGLEATRKFYEESGGADIRWVMPVPTFAEALIGEGNRPNGDIASARAALAWGEVYEIGEQTAVTAAKIADEIGPGGPYLDSPYALVAAVGRELNAPVVSADRDLTHPETQTVVDVEDYSDH